MLCHHHPGLAIGALAPNVLAGWYHILSTRRVKQVSGWALTIQNSQVSWPSPITSSQHTRNCTQSLIGHISYQKDTKYV